MKTFFRILIFVVLALSLSSVDSFAMMHGQGRHMGPYGGYCKGPRWGWYGAGRRVKTEQEVRELVTEFLVETELAPGEIRDEKTYFEVEVKDKNGEVIDLLIVDKRTCRIRSAY
jgi:hypothetical protein